MTYLIEELYWGSVRSPLCQKIYSKRGEQQNYRPIEEHIYRPVEEAIYSNILNPLKDHLRYLLRNQP
jgi:hypothetical protein